MHLSVKEYMMYRLYSLYSGCDNDTFACASGIDCIPMSSVCNGQFDCPDMSDEFGCGRLNTFIYALFILFINTKGSL